MNFTFASLFHQQSAATLLAYTAHTYMPILQPISSKANSWGFCVDFLFSGTCDETVLMLLTEEMRRNVAKDRKFKQISMMPKNAHDFLQKKQPHLAETLLQIDAAVVELVAIDDFYDRIDYETIATTGALKDFALLSIEKKEAYYEAFGDVAIVRIEGAVCASKKDVKQCIKAYALAKKNDPVQKAQKFVSLVDNHAIWLEDGLAFYEKAKESWKALCKAQHITQLLAPTSQLQENHIHYLQHKFLKQTVRSGQWYQKENILLPQEYEGLFQTKELLGDVIFRLCTNENIEEEFISSLQFIEKFNTIMHLDFGCVFICSRAKNMHAIQERLQTGMQKRGFAYSVEESTEPSAPICVAFRANDARCRTHIASTIQIANVFADKVLITQQSVCSLERVLALLLEKMEDTKKLES